MSWFWKPKASRTGLMNVSKLLGFFPVGITEHNR